MESWELGEEREERCGVGGGEGADFDVEWSAKGSFLNDGGRRSSERDRVDSPSPLPPPPLVPQLFLPSRRLALPSPDHYHLGSFLPRSSLAPHSLHGPISLLVNESCIKHLHKDLVLEADLKQLVFVHAARGSDVEAEEIKELWIVEKLYRVLPSYWEKVGEGEFSSLSFVVASETDGTFDAALRDEPGRCLLFEGGWEVPVEEEGLERVASESGGEKGSEG